MSALPGTSGRDTDRNQEASVRVNAYVLAADPTWLTRSVRAYYPAISRLVVSHDRSFRGWTGRRVAAKECLSLLKRLDDENKVELSPGDFHVYPHDPMAGETVQRQAALDAASDGADWVLQLDSDEVLPDLDLLIRALREAHEVGAVAVSWPMRVLYRRIRWNTFVQISTADGRPAYEYPAPVAVRAGSTLTRARGVEGMELRAVVRGEQAPPVDGVHCFEIPEAAAIWHNSWARSPLAVWRKIRSWGHSNDGPVERYFVTTWLPAPFIWRQLSNFHPFGWGWERLTVAPEPPWSKGADSQPMPPQVSRPRHGSRKGG